MPLSVPLKYLHHTLLMFVSLKSYEAIFIGTTFT